MKPDETLARWQAEEHALRERLAARAQPASPAPHEPLTGLQVMQAMIAGAFPAPFIGDTLGFVLIDVGHGRAVFQGRPDVRYYNPLGTVHGGWYAALLDSAMGCAVHSTLSAGKSYTTLELKINLVRALTSAVPVVRAEGRVVHAGRQIATAEARIVGADAKLYAHATTTCLIFEQRTGAG